MTTRPYCPMGGANAPQRALGVAGGRRGGNLHSPWLWLRASVPVEALPSPRNGSTPGPLHPSLYGVLTFWPRWATRLHQMLETPFNHLGYVLDYREMSAGLPDARTLSGYASVVSWIEADVIVEDEYFCRANEAMDAGVKWIVFGDIGASRDSRAHSEYDGFLRRLGLVDTGEYTTVTYDSTYDVVNADYFGFEAHFSNVLPGFPVFVAAGNPHLPPVCEPWDCALIDVSAGVSPWTLQWSFSQMAGAASQSAVVCFGVQI